MTSLLVTGANGFVGRALCATLEQCGHEVIGAVRKIRSAEPKHIKYITVGEVNGQTDWSIALAGVDVVIHLAARVHEMHDTASDPLARFCHVNMAGTENLARRAAANGVKRLVYVSSIKVNGEETLSGQHYFECDKPAPQDPYGISKWEAEQALHHVAKETGLEVVIVRPPLIYGAGVKGNFLQMIRVIARGIPIPLALVYNQRDLVYVDNLVDALIACATHPKAAGQTYLVSDGESISTNELIHSLAKALNKRYLVFPFPISVMRFCAGLFGKSAAVDRLTQSLQIDSSKIRKELSWKPPYTMQQGLQATADWYLQSIENKT